MRNLKKVLSLVLALMMVLSVMVTASASNFVDADSINYEEAVEVMAGLGVLNGVKNADDTYSFLPQDTLTREQAAKIVAYIKLGGELDDNLADTLANPFTDVNGWSEDVIKYCASQGIIDGVGNGLFLPKGTLKGYEFAKMLLVAAGINGEYTGSNWKYNIYTAAAAAGLLAGLENVVLSNELTREQAAQMAFNAMNYSPVGATTVFVVKNSGVTVWSGTDAMTALVYASIDGNILSTETISTGSLIDTVFAAKVSSYTDAFGRVSKTWISKTNPNVVYAALAATPVLTYTSGTTYGKIAADLGCTKVADKVELTLIDNGLAGTAAEYDKTMTDKKTYGIGDQGTLLEVYATATPGSYTVVKVDTYVRELAKTDIVAAKPATATSDAEAAYIKIGTMTYETAAFKAGDVVLYTKTATKLVDVVKANSFSGAVTAYGSGYFRVDGNKMVLSAHADGKIGVGLYGISETVNTYYTDAYGNVIYAVAGKAAEAPAAELIYVISKGSVAAKDGQVSGDLYDVITGDATPAKAQALVMDLATGEMGVKDIAIVKNTDGKYYYATVYGTASEVEVATSAVAPVEGLYAYNTLADGSIVLGAAVETEKVTLKKGVATVNGHYANGATVVNVLTYTKDTKGNYVSVEKTTYTGIANFPATAVEYANAYVDVNSDTNMVRSITVVKAAKAAEPEDVYAFYIGAGEVSADGQAYAFNLNGEVVNYYTASGVDLSTLVEGDLCIVEFNAKGQLTKATKQAADKTGEITRIEDTYLTIQVTETTEALYYFAEGCETIDAGADYAAGTIAVEDVVDLYLDDDGNIALIVIKAAE